MTVDEAIKEAIRLTNYSMIRLARDSKLTGKTIWNYCHARQTPGADAIRRIAETLGCTIETHGGEWYARKKSG